ncbi:MAG: glycoside hydrolase family 13 protein, partial [Epulopiscium sp.]|nr:glycoside hydrolase family 13 protein [Candidatus Epulonipiscium sp.]
FQLTVYDPSYQTPDWMKEAVVYQIFPDRFYNGNRENDTAKSNARGAEPIEYREWSQLPDNPRLKENEQDPTYDGDGIWGNDFFGGDIAGIHQKLDYIQSLGVNTLYLNPIAYAASNHKYDATDFKTLDPMFGTEEEFLAFTEELKKRGMHLIIDGVFNHVGDDSIYFDRYGKYETVGAYEYWSRVYDKMNDKGMTQEEAEAQAKEEFNKEGQQFSEYGFHHWFHIENEKMDVGLPTERYKYQCWWGFDSLPEFKSMTGEEAMALGLATKTNVEYASEYNNQKLVDYIFKEGSSVAKSWLLRGATGWRLDVANEVDPEFWREFRKELKDPSFQREIGCDPLILGEIWDDASQYFLGDQYDSVMNYRFRDAVIEYLKHGNAERTERELKTILEDYPKEAFYTLMNLMGSHDTARAIYILGNGSDRINRAEQDQKYDENLGMARLKLGAIFQMGYPGAPTIYYGDEAGITGSSDPDCRRPYSWGKENKELTHHYQTLGEARTKNKRLFAYGDLFTLHAQGDIYVYGRKYKNHVAIIAINRGDKEQQIQLDVSTIIQDGITLQDALDRDYQITIQEKNATIVLPPFCGRMLLQTK